MTLATAFTRLVGVEHPVVSAPMARSAGGALAGAVSEAGGLGLIGAALSNRDWLVRELDLVTARTSRPWGVGFLNWALAPDELDIALTYRPAVVMLGFGDSAPFVGAIRAAGARLVVQVADLDEARAAVDLRADMIVAQGSDAGGHSGQGAVGTMSFVPAVVDLAAPTPVLAAGGIADGRGLAAALALGAGGALIGTRFQASNEALVPPAVSKALVAGRGADTERSRVLDIARGSAWPARYPGRALTNAFLDEWRDRPDELAADEATLAAVRRGDIDAAAVWAGQALDLITSIEPAADLVAAIVAQAEDAIRQL